MSVVELSSKRRARVVVPSGARQPPRPPGYALAAEGARENAESLLRLATALCAIHRTFTTEAGIARAEAIRHEMRAILGQ